jgi:hypothetical protein
MAFEEVEVDVSSEEENTGPRASGSRAEEEITGQRASGSDADQSQYAVWKENAGLARGPSAGSDEENAGHIPSPGPPKPGVSALSWCGDQVCYYCVRPKWRRACLGPGGTQADAYKKTAERKAAKAEVLAAFAGSTEPSQTTEMPTAAKAKSKPKAKVKMIRVRAPELEHVSSSSTEGSKAANTLISILAVGLSSYGLGLCTKPVLSFCRSSAKSLNAQLGCCLTRRSRLSTVAATQTEPRAGLDVIYVCPAGKCFHMWQGCQGGTAKYRCSKCG